MLWMQGALLIDYCVMSCRLQFYAPMNQQSIVFSSIIKRSVMSSSLKNFVSLKLASTSDTI